VLLKTKYGFVFEVEEVEVNVRRLTNQMWKLIPMREHNEDWPKQLDTVILEIAGMHEIFMAPQFLQLLSKLEGLKAQETSFDFHRKTVFECISLLQELNRGIRL
jgi:hypothetical protein